MLSWEKLQKKSHQIHGPWIPRVNSARLFALGVLIGAWAARRVVEEQN